MSKTIGMLLALVVPLQGCVDEDCDSYDDVNPIFGTCSDGWSSSPPNHPPRSSGTSLGDGDRCYDFTDSCGIAANGTDRLEVLPNNAHDLQVQVTGGFEVTSLPTTVLPGPVQPLPFTLRAPGANERASIILSSSNFDRVTEEIAAYTVKDLAIVAPEGPNPYDFRAGPYLVPSSHPYFVVAIWSDRELRLVDTTLRSNSAAAVQLSWDTFQAPDVPGIYPIEFTSDSTGTIVLDVEVIGS